MHEANGPTRLLRGGGHNYISRRCSRARQSKGGAEEVGGASRENGGRDGAPFNFPSLYSLDGDGFAGRVCSSPTNEKPNCNKYQKFITFPTFTSGQKAAKK